MFSQTITRQKCRFWIILQKPWITFSDIFCTPNVSIFKKWLDEVSDVERWVAVHILCTDS